MISRASDHLLFVEPLRPASSVPLIDALTRKMAGAWRTRTQSDDGYDGVHGCTSCSAQSDDLDHFVVTADGRRLKTNSLAIHYLAYHREELPEDELAKVRSLAANAWEPTVEEMRGG